MSEKKVSTKTGLELLREPFPEHLISILPKPLKKDSPKGKCAECGGYHGLPAIHLNYVGHAALTHRLLDADPNWYWEPLALTPEGLPLFDKTGGLWIKLTVCGVTRLGYGNAQSSEYKDVGAREKEVIGDALRNAGMRFGAALDLWHKGDLHDEQDEVKPEIQEAPKPLKNHAPGVLNSVEEKKNVLADPGKNLSEKQVNRMWAIAKAGGYSNEQVFKMINGKDPAMLSKAQYDDVCNKLSVKNKDEDQIPF